MKFKTILLIVFSMSGSVVAQKAIDPTRVSVRAPRNETNADLSVAILAELRELRVGIVGRNADYEIQLNALPLVGCDGYAVAVLLTDRNAGGSVLRAYTSATVEGLARQIVRDANADFQDRKGAGTWR